MFFPPGTVPTDLGFLLMRLMVGAIFITSGWSDLRDPDARSKSIGMSKAFTIFLGASELLGSLGVMVGVLTQWAALGLISAGLRIESTQDALRAVNVVVNPTDPTKFIVTPVATNKSYINPFPSVQAQYRFGTDTILRAAYGMGIARPNFGDSAPYFAEDPNSFPRFRAGNPNLKPTHGQNFDLLLEHYLKPLGLIQGGFFYKVLTDPIFSYLVPFNGAKENLLVNGPSAHITGFEAAWQQRLSFLPGLLNGMGVRANYSYTTSRAVFLWPVVAPTIRHCCAPPQTTGTST